ncbi:YfiR/HmsC family protein [Thalassotalea atypica]|uniref:YfiR/HmsC family protein n=1 Tax=Thalassotalea atypica TaxID=2054316 RepID=UPI00257270EB|nr:YfiR/HmsC family protein [Thalassotalea atypica]
MKGKFAQLKSRFVMFVVSVALVVGGQTWAQSSAIDYEKAVLVSKFAKYIIWSAEAVQPQFVIGVYDDVEKYQYFSEFFANKGVKGKDISVRLVKTSNEAKDVRILYVSSPNKRRALKLTNKITNDSNVLVVTEGIKDVSKTMIDLSYNEKTTKIGFSVIEDNIAKGNLTLPELSLFTSNNDDVLSVSPTFLKKNKQAKQLLALQNELAKQKASVAQLNEKLKITTEKSKQQSLALQKESERLKAVQQKIEKQSEDIKTKDETLQRLEERLEGQESQLSMSKGDLQLAAEEKVKEQEQTLMELTDELSKQKQIVNNNAAKLKAMTDENKSLSIFQLLFYVCVVIALASLFAVFAMRKKANKDETQPSLLSVRENQLVKSENLAAIGYIATDVTYAVNVSLDELHEQLESSGDSAKASSLKSAVTLLDNFNTIAADQDDTDVQQFDLIAYIQKMMMLYQFEFEQSSTAYNYTGENALTIRSVPSYIALVLMSVVNNALKHGFDNKGHGKLTLNVEKGVKGGAKITVADDGKGMSKEVLAQVFTPFFTTASDRGYVGAGMSTSYELIKEKLSGNIEIESEEGKGTKVTITLP